MCVVDLHPYLLGAILVRKAFETCSSQNEHIGDRVFSKLYDVSENHCKSAHVLFLNL